MEYTDYYVAKGDAKSAQALVKKHAKQGMLMDDQKGFVPFVVLGEKRDFTKQWDWLLRVFDAEGAAWGFDVYVQGKQIASAVYGDNAEWGIDRSDNGMVGDLDETASALGINSSKLQKCLNDDGAEKFCKLIGFGHQYMLYPHESEMPDGVQLMSELF